MIFYIWAKGKTLTYKGKLYLSIGVNNNKYLPVFKGTFSFFFILVGILDAPYFGKLLLQ